MDKGKENRNFLNKEWEEAFHEFCRETSWQDKDHKNFDTYVIYWEKGLTNRDIQRLRKIKERAQNGTR